MRNPSSPTLIRSDSGLLRIVVLPTFFLVLSACTPEDPRQSLVAAWPFDEGSGVIARDMTGNGHDARLSGAGWGEGRDHGALVMDGGNDGIVTIALSERLRATDRGITLSAWTYRTSDHNVAVVSHSYPALFFGFHGMQFKWQFTDASGGDVACYADAAHVAELDRWIHLAATWDGWRARLYADGEEICSNWDWGRMAMPELPFTIGGYVDDNGAIVDELTGRLDDVRIYDRALSDKEIRALAGAS